MEALLTVKEVSSMLNIHLNTVYSMVKKGRIPFIKKEGVGIRFRKKDIDKWLEESSYKPVFNEISFNEKPVLVNLEEFDKLHLKGIKMSQKGKKIWHYPFGSVYYRLTKRGDKRWCIYFRVDGKPIRRTIKHAQTRADAVMVLRHEVKNALMNKYGNKKAEKRIKFNEFADLYLKNYAKQNKRSWKSDFYYLKNLKAFFGESELKEISPLSIEEYRIERLKSVKKSTVNRELAVMRRAFNLAIDWGYVNENPVQKVKFYSETDNLKERILSVEEEERLLKECSKDLKPIVLVALHTGMRRGEILNLKWSQVDLERRIIKVEGTKNGKIRHIPINDVLYEEFQKLKKSKENKEGFVFVNPKTGKPFKCIKRAFKKATVKAGIEGLRFHDLRHTFASRLTEKGVDLITVKDLLGHSTVKVTERYTHSNMNQKRKAVETLVKKQSNIDDSMHKMCKKDKMFVPNSLLSIN